jgi:hypothetical protein
VTPEAPWTAFGWREYSYGGFGGGHADFHLQGDRQKAGLADDPMEATVMINESFIGGRPMSTGGDGTTKES